MHRSRTVRDAGAAVAAAIGGLALACLVGGCHGDEEGGRDARAEAVGLHPAVGSILGDAEAPEPAVLTRGAEAGESSPEGRAREPDVGLRWSWDPPELRVYRSTAVHFRVESRPAGHETATCVWDFGDGSAKERGCHVSHTFHGGQSDQVVQLTLKDGDWRYTSTRRIPLERLPVAPDVVESSGGDDEGGSGAIPAPPEDGDTSFRLGLLADTAGEANEAPAARALVEDLDVDLLVHLGGLVPPEAGEEAWKPVRERLLEPAEEAGIPLAFATSPADRQAGAAERLPRPEGGEGGLQPMDLSSWPRRYSFTFRGAYFLVIGPSRREGISEEAIGWLRDELEKARVYEARYVFSYYPLHAFGDEHLGSLDERFRLYELFLRGRVTTFVSAAYRVFFEGRYGALRVVSVGAGAGAGGRLAGRSERQPASVTVMDQVEGTPERIFAVPGPSFDALLDPSRLPRSVKLYTR